MVPSASADRNGPGSKSKLSASVVASNGTNSNTMSPRNGVVRDLAEQMNEEEKHKYVKGISTTSCYTPDLSFD
jgi:cyclin-dependent kinase 7